MCIRDSSTPVCVLIPLSGWLASMIGYLTSGGVAESDAMTILVESIPLNFYCVIAVVGCLVLSLLGIDFGPMKKAEKRAAETGYLDDPKSNPDASKGDEEIQIDTDKPRMMNLLLPMLGMIAGVIVALIVTGEGSLLNGNGMQALLDVYKRQEYDILLNKSVKHLSLARDTHLMVEKMYIPNMNFTQLSDMRDKLQAELAAIKAE